LALERKLILSAHLRQGMTKSLGDRPGRLKSGGILNLATGMTSQAVRIPRIPGSIHGLG
jgi:hypothetical protein